MVLSCFVPYFLVPFEKRRRELVWLEQKRRKYSSPTLAAIGMFSTHRGIVTVQGRVLDFARKKKEKIRNTKSGERYASDLVNV